MTHPVDQALIEIKIREEKLTEMLLNKTEKEIQDILRYAMLREEHAAWCSVHEQQAFRRRV
jgi:hypothetical protein